MAMRRSMEPFNDKVRERIFGFGSRMTNASSTSGSEHDADCHFVSSSSSSSASSSSTCSTSPCLSYLVQNFLENADGVQSSGGAGDPSSTNDAEDDYLASDPTALIRDVINPIVRINGDRFRTDLIVHVSRAVEAFSLFRESQTVFNRNVMVHLRQIGYNAGVCKTKWEATPGGGLPAGSYEFIDVVRSSPPPPEAFSPDPCSRYVIDLNFAGQFEIARGTECYRRLLGALPRVFVGKSDDLKRIMRLMADETRRSMKINGMTLPPWRKNRYMQAKWFGPYRRTVNQLPLSATANEQAATSISAVKCRSVGFFTSAVDGVQLVAPPPTTRTR